MQLTRQGDYAVRAVLDLAIRDLYEGPGTLQASQQVAKRQGIPKAFLNKIIQALVRAGIIETLRGAAGGIRLARPAKEITLRQIVEAMEGTIALNRCLIGPLSCDRMQGCPVHPIWIRAQQAFLRELEQVTLEDIARQAAGAPAAEAGDASQDM